MSSNKKWKMPEWMEPYRESVECTAGGNSAEDMLHRLSTEKNLSQTNIIVWAMAYAVEEKVRLLTQLHEKGLLKTVE